MLRSKSISWLLSSLLIDYTDSANGKNSTVEEEAENPTGRHHNIRKFLIYSLYGNPVKIIANLEPSWNTPVAFERIGQEYSNFWISSGVRDRNQKITKLQMIVIFNQEY